jgi:hypothetical protein
VGTNELVEIEKVNVYPNPNNGHFTLSVTIPWKEEFDLRISNELGITVYEKHMLVIDGTLTEAIDLPNIPDGVYSVALIAANKQITRKIIVH